MESVIIRRRYTAFPVEPQSEQALRRRLAEEADQRPRKLVERQRDRRQEPRQHDASRVRPALGQALNAWRRESRHSHDSDWVSASNKTRGKTPRTAGVAGQDYLRPAALKAGVIPAGCRGRFEGRNLRHSLATFFAANDVNLPIVQSVLSRSKPETTAIYTHRVNSAQIEAQGKFLEAINITPMVNQEDLGVGSWVGGGQGGAENHPLND